MSRKATKYRALRARLIRRGTNPRRWAQDHKLPMSTVYAALRGDRAGVKTAEIRRKIEHYLLDA